MVSTKALNGERSKPETRTESVSATFRDALPSTVMLCTPSVMTKLSTSMPVLSSAVTELRMFHV